MRIRSLDSLRGIAALIVVFHHMRLMYPETPGWIRFSPLRILASGESAVLVFFILSGFVLFLTLNPKDGYWPFTIKRVWRIYPPFVASILISAVLWYAVDPSATVANISDWARDFNWQLRPTFSIIMGHLAMTDIEDLHSLNNVMWSLVVELRISLIFPLIALAVRRDWRTACVTSIVFSGFCNYIEQKHSPGWTFDPFATGRYLYLFVIGATMAMNADFIRQFIGALSGATRLALWCGALILFSIYPVNLGGLPTSIGATLLVALCFADKKTDDALTAPVPLWLGRVSYSLFLIHIPILMTAAHILSGTVPMAAVLAITLAVALLAAELLYRSVELPSIKIGRIMSDRFRTEPTVSHTLL